MPAKRLLLFLTIAVLLLALACKGSSGSHLPNLTPFDSEGLAKLHEIRDLAADVRGIGPCEKVNEGTLTREELTAYNVENEAKISDEDRKELDKMNKVFRLLHLIGPEVDLLESVTGMESSQVVGMYSNKEDKLVLVTDGEPNLNIDDEVTLAHEYVHCFQYGTFDFKRLGNLGDKEEEKKANTQYSDTIDALMEGDATMSSIFYARDKLGEEGFNNWVNGAGGGSSGNEEDSYPPALERYFNFPYDQGTDFALYLWKKGGWEELNKAYTNPPSTTEQILHPEKYLAGEKAEDLKLPDLSDDLGKDWKQLDDSVFGEFDVYNYLLTILGDEGLASDAAAGWGGGRVAEYSNKDDPERVLIHIVLTWDTPTDALQFFQAYLDSLLRIHGPVAVPESLHGEGKPLVWDGEGEHIYTVLDKRAFTLVVATDREDRDAAVAAMSLPSPDSPPTPP
jgi:hypothetical protein